DAVPRVAVRGVRRLVLAAQERGDVAGQPAEDDVRRVDDVPPALDLRRLGGGGGHRRGLRARQGVPPRPPPGPRAVAPAAPSLPAPPPGPPRPTLLFRGTSERPRPPVRVARPLVPELPP